MPGAKSTGKAALCIHLFSRLSLTPSNFSALKTILQENTPGAEHQSFSSIFPCREVNIEAPAKPLRTSGWSLSLGAFDFGWVHTLISGARDVRPWLVCRVVCWRTAAVSSLVLWRCSSRSGVATNERPLGLTPLPGWLELVHPRRGQSWLCFQVVPCTPSTSIPACCLTLHNGVACIMHVSCIIS